MMHFPLFQISPYFREIFKILPFPEKISRFSSAKISDDLFKSSTVNFEFPLFSLFQYISPLFRENYYSPTFKNTPSVLEKFNCFLHTLGLCVFRFPLL